MTQSTTTEETLALIKPNAFDKREEIIKLIKSKNFEVVESQELQLSQMRVQAFYAEHKGRSFFEELCKFMSSGKIVALKLKAVNAIKGWRELMGPTNVEQAKKDAPNSVRALYGKNMTENASHGSDSKDSAARELNFFFNVQETLALIKPNAVPNKDTIVKDITAYGLEIVTSVTFKLTKEQAQLFYDEHKERSFFGELVNFMTSDNIVAMKLKGPNAIKGWRFLMGPTNYKEAQKDYPLSIRGRFASGMTENGSHGSDSTDSAERELKLFFGDKGFTTKN